MRLVPDQVVEFGGRLTRKRHRGAHQPHRTAEQDVFQPLRKQVGDAVRNQERQIVGEQHHERNKPGMQPIATDEVMRNERRHHQDGDEITAVERNSMVMTHAATTPTKVPETRSKMRR